MPARPESSTLLSLQISALGSTFSFTVRQNSVSHLQLTNDLFLIASESSSLLSLWTWRRSTQWSADLIWLGRVPTLSDTSGIDWELEGILLEAWQENRWQIFRLAPFRKMERAVFRWTAGQKKKYNAAVNLLKELDRVLT